MDDPYTGMCYVLHSGGVPEVGLWFPRDALVELPSDFIEDLQYEESGELVLDFDERGDLSVRYSKDFSQLPYADRFAHIIELSASIRKKLLNSELFSDDFD